MKIVTETDKAYVRMIQEESYNRGFEKGWRKREQDIEPFLERVYRHAIKHAWRWWKRDKLAEEIMRDLKQFEYFQG